MIWTLISKLLHCSSCVGNHFVDCLTAFRLSRFLLLFPAPPAVQNTNDPLHILQFPLPQVIGHPYLPLDFPKVFYLDETYCFTGSHPTSRE